MVELGIAIAHRTKGTPGITGLSGPRVHIDGPVWHLNFRGGESEMISQALAYNGEALTRQATRRTGNTVGSLAFDAMTPYRLLRFM